MEARNLPDALQLIMDDRTWSQSRLARELGISQPHLSYVLAGKKDTAFSNAIEWLGRVDWEVRITPKGEGSEPVDRREFMTAVASVAFVPSSTTTPYQDPEYVRMLSGRVDRLFHEQGSTPAAVALHRYIAHTRAAIRGTHRELQAAVSGLARKASEVMVARGNVGDAERLTALALDLAKRAGDSEVQALAYMMSELARLAPLLDDAENDAYLATLYAESARWSNVEEIRNVREQVLDVLPRTVKSTRA